MSDRSSSDADFDSIKHFCDIVKVAFAMLAENNSSLATFTVGNDALICSHSERTQPLHVLCKDLRHEHIFVQNG